MCEQWSSIYNDHKAIQDHKRFPSSIKCSTATSPVHWGSLILVTNHFDHLTFYYNWYKLIGIKKKKCSVVQWLELIWLKSKIGFNDSRATEYIYILDNHDINE